MYTENKRENGLAMSCLWENSSTRGLNNKILRTIDNINVRGTFTIRIEQRLLGSNTWMHLMFNLSTVPLVSRKWHSCNYLVSQIKCKLFKINVLSLHLSIREVIPNSCTERVYVIKWQFINASYRNVIGWFYIYNFIMFCIFYTQKRRHFVHIIQTNNIIFICFDVDSYLICL